MGHQLHTEVGLIRLLDALEVARASTRDRRLRNSFDIARDDAAARLERVRIEQAIREYRRRRSHLTPIIVRCILEAIAQGVYHEEIARQWSISTSTVSLIRRGLIWQSVWKQFQQEKSNANHARQVVCGPVSERSIGPG